MQQIEKWDIFELTRFGRKDGNPFRDYTIKACFKSDNEEVTADGFYDGDGVYKIRFMPSFEGEYSYHITGNFADAIDEPDGRFAVTAPAGDNHGPVRAEGVCLRYADDTPYFSIGTTCYAWTAQPVALQEQTLDTLGKSCFNKLRFCIFPKFYIYNTKEPLTLPFERGSGEGLDPELVKREPESKMIFPGMKIVPSDFGFDYTRPNVEHFRLFDKRIRELRDMGIEADLILMHPYDRWGLNQMNRETCEQYLRYVTARYSAFRNVWWSLANEFDFILSKTKEDWEFYGETVSASDPYNHMLSIHNGYGPYDFSRPWITHCSLQRTDFYITTETTDKYIEQYGKPVVWDEVCYEGNIGLGWGNITPQEMVRRFWEAMLRGGHCGHGETYLDPDDILWWSHGGVLKGESPARLKFLLDILKDVPGGCLKKGDVMFDELVGYSGGSRGQGMERCYDYSIHYLGIMQPAVRELRLPEDCRYLVDLIDTWDMTVTPLGEMSGVNTVKMPGKQYMAIRIRKVEE